jgi:hypothetical protein
MNQYVQNINQPPQNMHVSGQYIQSPKPLPFDPSKLDRKIKRSLISYTMTCSQVGLYKKFPVYAPIAFPFVEDFEPGAPNNICDVIVEYEHVLDIAEKYAEHGSLNHQSNNNMNPVILNSVGREFNGSNFEENDQMRDEIINIRTNFNSTIGPPGKSPYPMKEDVCVYSKVLTIIRPKNLHLMGITGLQTFLPWPQSFRTAMITASPIKAEKENMLSGGSRMSSLDFAKTSTIIEAVFQAAINFNHQILILAPFGHLEENNPIDDIIKIYNYCIYKYGHKFKKIIIGVPPHYPEHVFTAYSKEIAKPQEIGYDVDQYYQKEELKKSLLEKSDTTHDSNIWVSVNNSNQLTDKKSKKKSHKQSVAVDGTSQLEQQYTKEQLEMFMKMMNTFNSNK